VVRANAVAEMFLDAVEVERREILSIGHRLEAIRFSAYSDESLDVSVPRRDVVVTDRPVDPVTLSFRRGEFVLAPPLAGPSPDYRLAADLIAANPVERFFLHVRVVTILDEEVRCVPAIFCRLADQ